MTTTTQRRLTAGPPADNLPALVANIHRDMMVAFDWIADGSGPMDTRTVLAILARQALNELANYWPEPARDTEFDLALFDLRCVLLPHILGNAPQVEVLRAAAQRIAQHTTELEGVRSSGPHKPPRAAWGQNDLVRLEEWLAGVAPDYLENTNPINFTLADAIIDYAESQRAEVVRQRERTDAPHYDWSGAGATPNIVLPVAPDGGLLVSSAAADENDEPVGVTVAAAEPDEEVAAERKNFPVFNQIWSETPLDIQETVQRLRSGTLTFRQVSPGRRRLIAQYVIASLPATAKSQRDYNAVKPAWMPTAVSLTQTLHVRWSDLVKMGSPWA